MVDEELHEIQLNGKQLVFLFMAGTVAAVVIFLCGLMVGRNLRSPKLESTAAAAEATVSDPTRADGIPLPPPTTATEGGTPASVKEDLTYSSRLEAPKPVEEHLREDDQKIDPTRPEPSPKAETKPPAPKETPAAAAPVTKTPAAPNAAAAATAPGEPAGNGWAVQVQAVTKREEADAIAKRLAAKGYPSFVTTSGANPTFYRIRVGKYPNKRDAEAIKTRLEKDEQFHPFLAR
jgi:cell division septation protein DedD